MWRRRHRTSATIFLILGALVLWAAPGSAVVTVAGSASAAPGAIHRIEASSPSPGHATKSGHPHKEGRVAVVASVIGIIAVIAFVVALGSISVRRRTRDGPPAWMRSPRDPPDRGRGLFG
jgi:hypothetical protein